MARTSLKSGRYNVVRWEMSGEYGGHWLEITLECGHSMTEYVDIDQRFVHPKWRRCDICTEAIKNILDTVTP